MRALLIAFCTGALVALCPPARAQEAGQFDARLREEVRMVPYGSYGIELETTVYRPPGEGPFPLVVINHGKSFGDSRFQPRSRYPLAALEFVRRGYVVAIPMRRGFSKSGGIYIGGGCNVASNGEEQAKDVRAVVEQFGKLPYVDRTRILIVGQSHGGLTTMAYGAAPDPGVKGLINFAGGLRQDTCSGWEGALARAFGSYGEAAKLPSLWFYGENDSYWKPDVYRAMHAAYVKSGASVRLVEFGVFRNDAHSMFSSRDGLAIWVPQVERFLEEIGMPSKAMVDLPARTVSPDLASPDKVPHLKDPGRTGYRRFLEQPMPRAFALSPGGAWGWASEGDDPVARALANCQKNSSTPCKIYAVDEQIVWNESK